MAARRSREARRLKENQIALRAAFLERENAALRQKVDEAEARMAEATRQRDELKAKLARYEGRSSSPSSTS